MPDVFNNAGTFTKSVTTGTTTIEAEFNNSGTANILTGTLSLSGGGTEGGGISLSSGTALVISGSIATFQNTSILSGGGSVTFSGGTATFNSGATYDPTGTTTVSGGTVNFNSSNVSITGPLKISAGTANLATGGSNITPSSITISGGVLTGSDTITTPAAVSWTGGSIGASGSTEILNATAGMSIVANAELSFPGGTINNTGVATWTGTGGYIYAFGADALERTPRSTMNRANFDVQSDEIYYGNGSQLTVPDVFNNAGTFTKSVTTGTTTIEAEFNNSGTANILTGTLSLSGGGTEGGGISLSSGTALVISGSIATFQNTSILSGGGSVTFSGGTATFNSGATYDPTGTTTVSGGTVNFNSSNVSITGPLKISAGTANLATGGSNITPSSITISGGVLTGSDTITTPAAVSWTGGSIGASGSTEILNATAGMSIVANAELSFPGGTINNTGVATWTGTGGYIYAFGANAPGKNTTFNNESSANFDVQSDEIYYGNGSQLTVPDVFNNAGTFTKSVTTGTTTIEAEFNNSGTANILTGTLSLSGGGTEGGGISLSSGTALVISGSIATFQNTSILSGGGSVTFSGGTATFNSGATYDPTGTTTVSGGTVNFNSSNVSITGPLKISAGTANLATGGSNITPSSITISGGVLTGSDTITTPAAVSWTGGSIGASGSTEILNATAGMSIVANAELSFPGGTINNTGVATWTGTGGYIYAFRRMRLERTPRSTMNRAPTSTFKAMKSITATDRSRRCPMSSTMPGPSPSR